MLDGREWTDLLLKVSDFKEVTGLNGLKGKCSDTNKKIIDDFDITSVKDIFIPYRGCTTHAEIEESHYSSGYFIMTDGEDLLIRICDGMVIPLKQYSHDVPAVLAVVIALKDNCIDFITDIVDPTYTDGEYPLYYVKTITPLLSDLIDSRTDNTRAAILLEAFRSRFKDGYSKIYTTESASKS